MIKRICLFAGYDRDGVVQDYVKFYLQAMSKFCDVYYMADCEMKAEEMAKVAPFVKGAWAYRHKKYDFGSWQETINKLGFDFLAQYDELILCNDSCFGPLFALEPIFENMHARQCDFWGLCENVYMGLTHLQSYFLVFNKNVFTSEVFKNFIKSIKEEISVDYVIINYELKFTQTLVDGGFKYKSFIKPSAIKFTITEAQTPNNYDCSYYWKDIIKLGHPFIKIKMFTHFIYMPFIASFRGWKKFFKKHTNYDVSLIENKFKDTLPDTESLDYLFRRVKLYIDCNIRKKNVRL